MHGPTVMKELNMMSSHCSRHSSPRAAALALANGGFPGEGYTMAIAGTGAGATASPKTRDKSRPPVTLPGTVWKIFLGGGNRRFLHQMTVLLVVFAFLTSALVILDSFGTLLAWQQCISTRITNTLALAEIQSIGSPDILDSHKLEYDNSLAGFQAPCAPTAAVKPTISRSTKLRFKKEPATDSPSIKESWFLNQLNGTIPCKYSATTDVYVFGLDKPSEEGIIRLPVDEDHDIVLVSYDKNAVRRCSGGDYFETDLNGTQWKSRPPISDLGDGSYTVKMRMDKRFAGTYSLKVIFLFGGFSGLKRTPQKHAKFKMVLNVTVEFYVPECECECESRIVQQQDDFLPLCSTEDLQTYPWQGRWTRTKANESCAADSEGRWRCLDPDEPCERPWCEGPVGRLESNGWAYSAHCHFRIFTQNQAWQCLSGKHLFFWGDSNHPDTTRNLLNFLLGRNFSNFPWIYDRTFVNPLNPEQEVRFTVLFNGHVVMKFNNMGLSVLKNESYAANIRTMMDRESGNHIPDAFIHNSGIHDGIWWKNINEYVHAASTASNFWASVWRNTSHDESKRPKVVYRTTIAPAGNSRNMPVNPQKMEILNAIIVENIVKVFGRENLLIVDEFDMTFPFHYDNFCSDGGHYGGMPNPNSWWPGGHMYFVDVMLAHILLNTLCPL